MLKAGKVLLALFLFAAMWGMPSAPIAKAQPGAAEEPRQRVTTITVDTVEYEWWVLRWENNYLLCQVFVDHEGIPTNQEILSNCGTNLYNEWLKTPACLDPMNAASCSGLYLYFVSYGPVQHTIEVELPPPSVEVSLSGCVPSVPENLCPLIPNLLLTGIEPLPNEQIMTIHYLVDGIEYFCPGSPCEAPLSPTGLEGKVVEFWADSSFGDSSVHYTAQVRVIDSGVAATPGWYVDVLSTQWRGRDLLSCAETWQAFPPVGGPPLWLTTPEIPALMETTEPYYFLAGRLISQGVVDASACMDGGLLPNGYADECGLEKALPAVQEWQNQFDARIIEVAAQTGVPAQLMKNLFARESQFWPGRFNSEHLGLGHITDNGAEVLLLWNADFFDQFCPLVLDGSVCARGYIHLGADEQAILRGALASRARTDCIDCPAGIDLTSADASVDLFAQTLLANCNQVAQEVYNATKQTPGVVSSYEDLWRFTLANYHAGPGCLSYALYTTHSKALPLTWDNVSQNFTPICQGVVDYVAQIAK